MLQTAKEPQYLLSREVSFVAIAIISLESSSDISITTIFSMCPCTSERALVIYPIDCVLLDTYSLNTDSLTAHAPSS